MLKYQKWIFWSSLVWFSDLQQRQALIQTTLAFVVLKWTAKPYPNHAKYASKPYKQHQLHTESKLLVQPLLVTNAAHRLNGRTRQAQYLARFQPETYYFSKTFIWFNKNKRISSVHFMGFFWQEKCSRRKNSILYILAGFRPNSEIIGKFRKLGKCHGQFVEHQKWSLQTKIWVRRRILEPGYRNMKSWNFRAGQLPLKIIFLQNFFLQREERSQLHLQYHFHDKISLHSRVIPKVLFLEHQRF